MCVWVLTTTVVTSCHIDIPLTPKYVLYVYLCVRVCVIGYEERFVCCLVIRFLFTIIIYIYLLLWYASPLSSLHTGCLCLCLCVCVCPFFCIFYFLTCYNATFFDCFRLCFLSTFDLPFLVEISKSALTWEMQLRCSTWYRWVESPPPPTMHSPTIYLHIIRCLLRFSPPFSFTYFSLW